MKNLGEDSSVFCSDSRFDLDLKFGKGGEQWLLDLLGGKLGPVEVKTERNIWADTGRMFFEFGSRGKPSGLAVTKSKYWAIVFYKAGTYCGVVVLDTEILKENLRGFYRELNSQIKKDPEWTSLQNGVELKSGGDNNTSEGLLVPIYLVSQLIHP